jgi:hypothetical protein
MGEGKAGPGRMKRLILLDQTTQGCTGKDRTKRGKANFKTDRNDARGIAQMMRVGLYRPVIELWVRYGTLSRPGIEGIAARAPTLRKI